MVTPRVFKEVLGKSCDAITQILAANYAEAFKEIPSLNQDVREGVQRWNRFKIRQQQKKQLEEQTREGKDAQNKTTEVPT